jgi:hypothetical protein
VGSAVALPLVAGLFGLAVHDLVATILGRHVAIAVAALFSGIVKIDVFGLWIRHFASFFVT